MSVNYVCKHCHTLIGRIEGAAINQSRLGFDMLTPEEHRHYVRVHDNGDVTVRMTCDYCAEAYNHNPELSTLASPLQ
ncbi:anti-sigma-F factor Fin [Paenibacillus taiwanensis]|uniref:anti-sigma-F factor Fin n=1 Tax=Paenibacillus taiwanensis TaxID=401638 RepID=UPI0003FDDE76|nr:anti-sigma-F factor Fin [Paenibacillus taiwanensis]